LDPVDWDKLYGQALATAEKTSGRAMGLAAGVSSAMQSQALSNLERAVPGISRLRDRLVRMANQDLTEASSGKLPKEVEDNLSRLAAERGLSVGGRGSFQDFSLLRDFGLSTLDYQQAKRVSALQTISQVTGMMPVINPTSPLYFMANPQTIVGETLTDRRLQFQEDVANRRLQFQADVARSHLQFQADVARSKDVANAENARRGMMFDAIKSFGGAVGSWVTGQFGP